MEKITVALIVRDEEKNIHDCLKTIKWADEILIVDQGSTDRTVQICREYTDKIFITKPKGTCNADRMFAISKATNEWILFLDADERLIPELAHEIKAILKDPQGYNGFYLGRKNFFCGKWIRGCGWYPAYSLKLFKKGCAYFPARVHHDGYLIKGRAGYLKEKSLHYTYNSIEEFVQKMNRFTTRAAEEEYLLGKKINARNFIIYFLSRSVFHFFRKYFLMLGFRDGFWGLFISLSPALTIFLTYAKLWAKQNK